MAMADQIVLASSSPRRRRLLERLGLDPLVISPDIDEARRAGESPEEYVRRAAREKALAVAEGLGDKGGRRPWVVGADTAVVVDGEPLGKPRDPVEAAAMLRRLGGREHVVLTGWTLLKLHGPETGGVEATRVRFKPLRQSEIDAYVATGEGLDKAGAYGIQGLGCFFVESVEGNYDNVVGLPVCPFIEALQTVSAIDCFPLPPNQEPGHDDR